MLVALVSAKGSPGVTTAALALAAAAGPGPRLLAELDPSGGDLELLTGTHGVAGLPRVVAGLRHGVDPARIRSEVTEVVGGIPAVVSDVGGRPAEAAILAAAGRLGPALAALGDLVIADVGRWAPSQPTASRIEGASVVGVVCHATPSSVEHARWLVEDLRATRVAPVMVVLVGDKPYPVAEVRAVFPVPVTRPLARDPAGVAALYAGAGSRRYRFTMLARTAREVLDELRARAGQVSGAA